METIVMAATSSKQGWNSLWDLNRSLDRHEQALAKAVQAFELKLSEDEEF
jgi:hypothetical protein